MAIPVANFNFYANALEVVFEDLTSNTPTSWAWNFGDGNNSILKNPTHTYVAEGKFKVSLVATNTDGSSTFEYEILVSLNATLNQTVETMVREALPSGLTIPAIELTQSVRRWQMYLQPKIYMPFEVLPADTFKQEKYPGLANVLISKLIVYEQLIEQASKTMISTLTSDGGASTSGTIKKIESGPSVAEWYNTSETWKTIFAGKTDTGFFGSMLQDVCIFAGRQNISIPELCGRRKTTVLFGVSYLACPSPWVWPISKG